MAITLNNLDELKMYIQAQINETLRDEVKTAVTQTVSKVGRGVIYGAYPKPKVYARRAGTGESVLDPENFSGIVDDGVLTIKSTASPNYRYNGEHDYTVKSLAELIEYGNNYNGQKYSFPTPEIRGPRPFIQESVEYLSQTKTLYQAMAAGLKKRGLTVK